jgi:outer membrane protein TolC
MKTILRLILILLLLPAVVSGQQSEVLSQYIKEGLERNEAIRQQQFNLQKSMYALKEATGMFLPSLNLQAQYTLSQGGRQIDLPLGDILNPVYGNLDSINHAFRPGSPDYPTLNNQSVQLNPDNFYNAYFRTQVPIINAEVWYNRAVKKQMIGLQQAEVAVYKRELAKDIQTAYYRYLQANEATRIFENAIALVQESERINRKLVENGSAVSYVISRSRSEISKLNTQLSEARNNKQNAAAYFNFLLNKSTEEAIIVDSVLAKKLFELPVAEGSSVAGREELQKLNSAMNINHKLVDLSKATWIPKVGAQLDLGSQAFDFKFNKQSRYYLFGLSFDWSIFKGLSDVNKMKQAQLDVQSLDAQTKYVKQQLDLQLTTSRNSYGNAVVQYNNTFEQIDASSQYFRITERRYREGSVSYIEYLDARNELTTAQLQQSISYFNAWTKYAEMQRAGASFKF